MERISAMAMVMLMVTVWFEVYQIELINQNFKSGFRVNELMVTV